MASDLGGEVVKGKIKLGKHISFFCLLKKIATLSS